MGKLGKFEKEVERFKWNSEFFRSPKGIELSRKYKIEGYVQRLLRQLEGRTIRDWIEDRHMHARNHEKDMSLEQIGFGPKSRDVYLRSIGYLEIAPIDIRARKFEFFPCRQL